MKHTLSPTEVNYRANIFALKLLGVEYCISVNAVGSLAEDFHPGDLCVPDQLIDRTYARQSTFFSEGIVAHVSLADPFCGELRAALLRHARKVGKASKFSVHDGGTYVCMEGPAFSTRAESNLYRSWGAKLIGMTALPEAKLAREAEISYAGLSLVTDYDCWKVDEAHVEVAKIIEVMHRNTENAKAILKSLLSDAESLKRSEAAEHALKHAFITNLQNAPADTVARLRPLIGKYL